MRYEMVDADEFRKRIPEFSSLYELCFNQEMTPEEIEWRYFKNPNPGLLACFAYDDDDNLVANYSVTPIEINIDGKNYPAVESLNTMTHPDYMGKGLFVTLAKEVYDEAARQGYYCVIGFPNDISNQTFLRRLNWKNIDSFPMMKLDLEKYRKRKQPETKYEIAEDDDFDLDYTKFNDYKEDEYLGKKTKYSFYKSNDFLKFRFKDNPRNEYYVLTALKDGKPEGYIVYKYYNDIVNIVDFKFSDIQAFEELLSKLIDIALKKDKKLMTLWSKLGTEEHVLLERNGFKVSPGITYFGGAIFNDKELDWEEFGDNRNWFITLADDNVY